MLFEDPPMIKVVNEVDVLFILQFVMTFVPPAILNAPDAVCIGQFVIVFDDPIIFTVAAEFAVVVKEQSVMVFDDPVILTAGVLATVGCIFNDSMRTLLVAITK